MPFIDLLCKDHQESSLCCLISLCFSTKLQINRMQKQTLLSYHFKHWLRTPWIT